MCDLGTPVPGDKNNIDNLVFSHFSVPCGQTLLASSDVFQAYPLGALGVGKKTLLVLLTWVFVLLTGGFKNTTKWLVEND